MPLRGHKLDLNIADRISREVCKQYSTFIQMPYHHLLSRMEFGNVDVGTPKF